MEAGCDPMALHGHAVRGLGLIGDAAASGGTVIVRPRCSNRCVCQAMCSCPERSDAAPPIAWCRLGSNRPAVEVWARRGRHAQAVPWGGFWGCFWRLLLNMPLLLHWKDALSMGQ